MRTRPAATHDLPGIGCGFSFVNDKRSCRPLPCGFFVFISPAAIIGHGIAIEKRAILSCKPRVVDQHDDCFAAYVQAFIVIPIIFRRNRAVPDKNHLRIFYGRFTDNALGPGHIFVRISECAAFTFPFYIQFAVRIGGNFDQRNFLEKAVAVPGLQTELLKFRFEKTDGLFFARGRWLTPLKFIRAQHLDICG